MYCAYFKNQHHTESHLTLLKISYVPKTLNALSDCFCGFPELARFYAARAIDCRGRRPICGCKRLRLTRNCLRFIPKLTMVALGHDKTLIHCESSKMSRPPQITSLHA
eukprot:TRINITY_DN7449_c0_g3_i1.p1 TRINITY_DN7449_c0_g3~~TRINITY_DN7449_c0_g3_i1.p1  ORF type:complete len:108 (-),score=4.03 TRINITY_DN7449_c0_g3_i1:184-507(-)